MTVYIPTLGRPGNMLKIVPRWLEQDIPVRLVVVPGEYNAYREVRNRNGWPIAITALPPRLRGIGATRAYCVDHANIRRLKSVIFSDDDMRPKAGTDMRLLLKAAEDKRVLGIGAVRSIHDYFTGGAVTRNSGIIICPGAWGHQLFAINIANTLRLGNFESQFYAHGEDGELHRQGIAAGIPWLVHCDVWAEQVGNVGAEGGVSSLFESPEERAAAEVEAKAIVHERWPEYAYKPGKRSQVQWTKMMNDFIPGWKDRSAIHDGPLNWDGTPR